MKKYGIKTITLILMLSMLFSVVSTVVYAADSQSDDYYRITTAKQLNEVRNNLGGKYILCANINLSGQSWEPIGSLESPFTGSFDGNGYTISNVTINKHLTVDNVSSSEMNLGFFGYAKGATIKNLGIENAQYNVTTGDFSDTNFLNVGGIAGTLNNTNVECSYFKGSIRNSAGSYVFARSGGIAAIGLNSSVSNCYSHSRVYANAVKMNTMAAGIVAWLDVVTIDKCYAAGSVVSENDTGYCYSGGVNASGDGIVRNSVVLLETLTANGTTNLCDNIGNFSEHSNNKVLSADSSEAIQQSTYKSLGWNFTNVWKIESSYPTLIKSSKIEPPKYVIYDREFDENIDYYTANCDSSEYNPTLANMLAALSAAAYDETKITNAYKSLGFDVDDNTKYKIYDYNSQDPFRCGHTISYKKSEFTDDVICLITVRGTSTKYNIIGDVWIDITPDGKHAGFAYAANYIYLDLKNSLPDQSSLQNIKYVITGHSLGGAVGNLLSVDLMEKGVAAENIYNYNFACPDVACLKSVPVSYTNIFNICNTEDFVPYLPGELCNVFTNDDGAWWIKYGQTEWFTYEDEKISAFSNHEMDLYLEFLNQQIDRSKFPCSTSSKLAPWFAKILCPVDVIIRDNEGNQVASVINGEVIYHDSSFEDPIFVFTDGDKKVVYIQDDAKFNVDLIGTDNGTMTFTLGKYDLATGEFSESKTFNNVILEKGKTMYCPVDETTEIGGVSLFVVEEKDGELIYTHTIGTDGTEMPIKTNPSMDKDDSNESKPSDTLGKNNDASIFDMLKNISKKTIIIVGASIAGVILLVIICVIVKKKKSK